MHTLKNIHIVHYSENLLDIVSVDILKRCEHLLPDLRSITIFLPNYLAHKPICNKLIKHAAKYGQDALLLPNCTTLRKWALSRHPPNKPLLSQYARELILVDAINQQPKLFENANPWAIANELLSFFDAMSLNNIEPLSFQNLFDQHTSSTHASYALSQEAHLVTSLWQAWREQLLSETMLDPVEAYIQALQKAEFSTQDTYYAAGIDQLSKHELSLFEKIQDESNLCLYLHASDAELATKPDLAIKAFVDSNSGANSQRVEKISPNCKILDAVFSANGPSIKQRAENFADTYPDSPLNNHLKIYKSNSFEHHVKALDIKIRSCIHRHRQNIGVVTADRRLVRRLRAILEHANVQVNDLGGWALATTSAAVVIEFWLQLVEESYSAKHLLALAQSPFFPVSIEEQVHDNAIHFFEKKIILAFNLNNGLNLFHNALEQFQTKHEDENTQIFTYLHQLLDKFEDATQSLFKLRNSKSIPLHCFFEELINGLKTSGIYTMLRKDAAGKQVIDLFESQISHFKHIENEIAWSEWRRFLTRILDQQNYKPPSVNSNVTFCSLEQSRLLNFDTLIIASVDKDNFPGTSINYTFFNERIRSELNIPTWLDEHALHFYLFRKLLDAAPDVLITVQREQDGEKITPSPWLEAIEIFHLMAYGDNLFDKTLQTLVSQDNTSIEQIQKTMPTLSSRPSPMLTEDLKPDSISISQYQILMSCPYQFFTTVCLEIQKTNILSEELDKADFGSLIHKCIHAFFVDVSSIPGPFNEKVTTKNYLAAEKLLNTISKYIFNQYTQRGFSDQLWLQRWLNLVPKFIDWEISRQENYAPYKHEISLQKNLNATTSLNGRIDRIDKSDEGYAIIDYKTGQTATQKSVLAGEQVQLPAYALLNENCNQVEYVAIGKDNNVKTESVLKDQQLENLVNEHRIRLSEIANTLSDKMQLTALADDDTCERCQVRGLCRKDYWQA